MTRASWKHHAAVAALLAAPVLAAGSPALAQSGPAPTPAAADVARATAFFQKGSELLKLKRYIPALEQFKQSYAAVPSPNSHLYIARCLALIGETRAAYLEFDRVVDEAGARAATEPKYAPARDSARVERDELAPRLALLTLHVAHPDPASVVHAGAYLVPADRWNRTFPMEPGTFDARVETPGRAPVKMRVTLGAGDRRELTLEAGGAGGVAPVGVGPAPVVAVKSKTNPLRVGGFVAAGVGVVGLGVFAGAGVVSQGTFSDLKVKCGSTGGCHGMNVKDEISRGKTQQAIANAGLIVGIVGVAAGATLIVLSTRTPKDADGRPTADLVVGPGWLGARGEF